MAHIIKVYTLCAILIRVTVDKLCKIFVNSVLNLIIAKSCFL